MGGLLVKTHGIVIDGYRYRGGGRVEANSWQLDEGQLGVVVCGIGRVALAVFLLLYLLCGCALSPCTSAHGNGSDIM